MTGDELDRLTQLVIVRSPALRLYARQWLNDSATEDVVQESLTSLLSQRIAPDDPVAWMYRTVRNAAIDHSRAAASRKRREQAVAESKGRWLDDSPDAAIDARSAEQALRALPPDVREIVILRIWGGLGFAQIAVIANVTPSAVHKRYTAALAQLRTTLEKPCKTTL